MDSYLKGLALEVVYFGFIIANNEV